MEKNKVGINQLALMYLLAIAGGKFLNLPSILAKDVGHDSWLTLAFGFVFDAVCLTFLLWAVKLNQKNSLDIQEILNKTVSKVVSKIILALFLVIFIIRANILMASCYKLFAVTFDVSTNWIVYALPIVDSIKVKNNKVFLPVLSAFAIGSLLTIAMNAIFVSLYGSMAQDIDLALSKIGVYFVSNSSNGRWDWITLSVWLISVFLKIIVFIYCAYKCLEKLFEFNSSKLNIYAVIFITLTLMLPMFVSTDVVLSTIVAWGMIPFMIAQYLLPIAMPFLTKIANIKMEKGV